MATDPSSAANQEASSRARSERLETLRRSGLLDSTAEEQLDRLTRLAIRLLGVSGAAVSLVDDRREHFRSALGLAEPWASRRRVPLTHSLGKHVVEGGEPLVVTDAREHPTLRDSPAVTEMGVAAYAGMPLGPGSGPPIGVFSVWSEAPAKWSDDDLEVLTVLATSASREMELRLAERARARAREELREARELAERANRSKGNFLARMSHEIRTPLNSVIGFANVLIRKASDLDPTLRNYLERIRANGTHLLHIVNDILDLSKIEAGRVDVAQEPVDVVALSRSVVAALEPGARDDVSVRYEGPEKLEPVDSDEAKLRQILTNLVGNALKFTDEGEVVVSVTADGGGRATAVEVRDTGVGIPREHLESIFQAFEQAEGGTDRRYGGTGLGLAISRSLARVMGHEITVRSAPGEGSTFTLLLEPQQPPG